MERPHVDVIVATRDRPDDLERLLPTLAAQTHATFMCTIVDQSEDPAATGRLLGGLDDPRFRHIVDARRGKSRALNLALGMTDAPVIAFTDDDCEVPTDWLATALAAIHDLGAPGIVFGRVVACTHDPAVSFVPAIDFVPERRWSRPLRRTPGLVGMGANMIVSRELVAACGGFDEDLGPGTDIGNGEECEYAYRALAAGFVVGQDHDLSVLHWGVRSRADGAARDLVLRGFRGIGAAYGKHLAAGDAAALAVALDETRVATGDLTRALVARRPPYHVRRIVAFWQGVACGVRVGRSAV